MPRASAAPLLFVLSFFLPSPARAWGPIGHRVVGKIAENHLSSKAKAGVRALLGHDTLALASTWADDVRSHPDSAKYGPFAPWHYATVPFGENYKPAHAPPQGDIIVALSRGEATLRDPKAAREAKIEALRLLAHLVGDLHQPLHVGNGTDRGGNLCFVKWFGSRKNLHSLWDDALIDHMKLSYTEYVDFLDHPAEEDIARWQSGSFAAWADESSALLAEVYPGPAPEGGKPPERPYCAKEPKEDIPDAALPELDWKYHFRARPIFERRLLQGGLRLAGLLNSVFK